MYDAAPDAGTATRLPHGKGRNDLRTYVIVHVGSCCAAALGLCTGLGMCVAVAVAMSVSANVLVYECSSLRGKVCQRRSHAKI